MTAPETPHLQPAPPPTCPLPNWPTPPPNSFPIIFHPTPRYRTKTPPPAYIYHIPFSMPFAEFTSLMTRVVECRNRRRYLGIAYEVEGAEEGCKGVVFKREEGYMVFLSRGKEGNGVMVVRGLGIGEWRPVGVGAGGGN
ncbi:hypothetical protein EX30DRAFT_398483 [Ascodesmis nigricans]|uniref:Uncharacterized protein n=1 Tax=Ascodesmis nigricans TaxID=341454 RepID=A0A4S2MKS1_9PEZI|nr:hypothetical protein EX30DRAFT_398483 [Ascodesmis nigricans]